MKTILVLTMAVLLSLTLVSASYDFNYEKPSVDYLVNPVFQLSKVIGINQVSNIMYALLSTARFWESQAVMCEAELKTRTGRSGGSSSPQIQTPVKEYEDGDVNKDGVVNGFDLAQVRRDLKNIISGNENGDKNGDGTVNAFDLAKVRRDQLAITG